MGLGLQGLKLIGGDSEPLYQFLIASSRCYVLWILFLLLLYIERGACSCSCTGLIYCLFQVLSLKIEDPSGFKDTLFGGLAKRALFESVTT